MDTVFHFLALPSAIDWRGGSDHCVPLLDNSSALQKSTKCPVANSSAWHCPAFITTFESSNEKKRLFHFSLFWRRDWGLGPGSGLLSVLLFPVGRTLRGCLSHSSMGSNSHSDLQPAKKEHGPPRRQGHAITFADTLQYLRASLVAQMVKNLPEQLTLSLLISKPLATISP